jgi:hypothetical protein
MLLSVVEGDEIEWKARPGEVWIVGPDTLRGHFRITEKSTGWYTDYMYDSVVSENWKYAEDDFTRWVKQVRDGKAQMDDW